MSESPVSRRFPWLAYGLFALAGGLVANSLLGPSSRRRSATTT